jgi:hypothetical protein
VALTARLSNVGPLVQRQQATIQAYLQSLYALQSATQPPASQEELARGAAEYFANGAEATAAPTAGPGAAFFQNGGEVLSGPTTSWEPANPHQGAGAFGNMNGGAQAENTTADAGTAQGAAPKAGMTWNLIPAPAETAAPPEPATAAAPTAAPTAAPETAPTAIPTAAPTAAPEPPSPTAIPTAAPTAAPEPPSPTAIPTAAPTAAPEEPPAPTAIPTAAPTGIPTRPAISSLPPASGPTRASSPSSGRWLLPFLFGTTAIGAMLALAARTRPRRAPPI